MDAFFTIASPVPAEEPVEDILVDTDAIGTNGNHGSHLMAKPLFHDFASIRSTTVHGPAFRSTRDTLFTSINA
ncbi:hypothetical protein ONZ51_g12186 [Trametes cubensis]|nr:hypothetical protein ONZ51_g12186 [Trametes cubensis]